MDPLLKEYDWTLGEMKERFLDDQPLSAMNSEPPPPPFGDPTSIHQENASAVGKGIAVGCGGCLGVLVLGALLLGGILYGALSFMQGSDICQRTLHAAQNSEFLKRELGEPISLGWWITGRVKIVNDSGKADVVIPVSGPQGSTNIHTVGLLRDGVWQFSEMTTRLPSGETVNLLTHSPPAKESKP